MDSVMLMKFKAIFEKQRQNLIYTRSIVDKEFQLQPDDLLDEMDQTTSELEQSMRMRLRNREALYLRKLDEAIARIQEGSFGLCGCCGEDIEARRLEARPTTTLCMGCKEEEERRERIHIDGHRSKSLGARLRLA